MKYYIGDYERNGHDDSDFFVVFWNTETLKIETVEYASTRYGGGWNWHAELIRTFTPEALEQLRQHRQEILISAYEEAEKERVLEPQPEDLKHGTWVRILKDSAKHSKNTYKKHQEGEVFWQGWYGTFYRIGYNTRGRHNGRIGIRLANGDKIFCPMKVVRLKEEPNLEQARLRAIKNALCISCPGAWWSNLNQQVAI